MLSQEMQDALNHQQNAELYSAYLYLSMSAYFESVNLPGAAHWMRCQAQEELLHASKFFAYISDGTGRVMMAPIDGPPTEWDSALAVYQNAYAHEVKVSRLIDKLVDLAAQEGDHATEEFLQWFVAEQVEEEESADEAVQKLKLAGDSGALLKVDQLFGERAVVFSAGGDGQ